jgi:hypothetical protein
MSFTVKQFFPADGHTLDSGLREIVDASGVGVRVELAPQSPFSGDPEFDTDKDFLTTPSPWTVANGSNADVIAANSTEKSQLTINGNATSTAWYSSTASGPFVYQVISGDFDIWAKIRFGAGVDYHRAGLFAQSTSDAQDWEASRLLTNASGLGTNSCITSSEATTVNNSTTEVFANLPANSQAVGGGVLVRLRRTGNDFYKYLSFDGGANWTQIGSTRTRADFSSGANVGIAVDWQNTSNTFQLGADFLRSWPPYLTTSPTSYLILDSGIDGTSWDMSTFIALENEFKEYSPQSQIGFGTLKYKYGAGNSSPPSLNASWLTKAQMASESDVTGRYFKLAVQYISATGAEMPSFNGASIDAVVSGGGGMLRALSLSGGLL